MWVSGTFRANVMPTEHAGQSGGEDVTPSEFFADAKNREETVKLLEILHTETNDHGVHQRTTKILKKINELKDKSRFIISDDY